MTARSADGTPARWAATLVRTARTGALATLEKGTGAPYASLVAVATDPAGVPLMLISRLALHTQNLLADPRASLMLDAQSMAGGGRGADDPLSLGRVTLIGHAERIDPGRARERYLARHPAAAIYVDFPDFAFYALHVERAHFIGGFGRIVDLPGSDLQLTAKIAAALAPTEADIVTHMNNDHIDAVQLYATALLGENPADWRLSGIDPMGLDLVSGAGTARLWFDEPVLTSGAVRAELVRRAAEARRRAAAA